MNFLRLFKAGIAATQNEEYPKGVCSHHGVTISSKDIAVAITYIPSEIYSGKHNKKLCIKINPLRVIPKLSGEYTSPVPFSRKEIDEIESYICRTETGYTDPSIILEKEEGPRGELIYIIDFRPSKGFRKAFHYYRDMKDVFNFTKKESKMSIQWHKHWSRKTKEFIKLFEGI